MFWEQDIETASRESLQALQLARLKETVGRLAQKSPFYQEKFRASGY